MKLPTLESPGGGREGVLQTDRRRTGARNNCARSIFHAAHRLEEDPTHTTHTHKSSPAQPYRSGAGQGRDGGPAGRELVPGQDTAFSGLEGLGCLTRRRTRRRKDEGGR